MSDRYEQYAGDLSTEIMQEARFACDQMDAIDRQNGILPMTDHLFSEQLRTALTALFTAMESGEWQIVGEAACLIQDAERDLRDSGQ